MKSVLKILPAIALFLMVYGCQPEDKALPDDQQPPFSDSELLDLIDPSYLESDPNARGYKPVITYNPVFDMVNGGVEIGKSVLVRARKGVAFAFKSYMEPGHTATIWWVFFNNPENCIATPCGGSNTDEFGPFTDFVYGETTGLGMLYAAGTVASNKGIAVFAGHLREGDLPNGANEILFGFPDQPLEDSSTPDIRLVLRSHGPKIPGQVLDQISSHGGGCEVDFAPFSAVPMNEGECADIYVSPHFLY